MAAKSVNWASVDLSGKPGGYVQVKVAGMEIPVAQFSMTYELNSIPTATVSVALGRNAKTAAPSSIYALVSRLKKMAEVTVKLVGKLGDWSTTGAGGKKIPFPQPEGGAVLFIGYISGLSYQRSSGQISAVLSLTNKLVDLTMASGGSADAVPGAPNDYFLPIFTAGAGTAGTAAARYADMFPQNIYDDFSKGILDVLHLVASTNEMQQGTVWCSSSRTDGTNTNQLAVDVIKGKDDWKGIYNYNTTSTYTTKYPLQLGGDGVNAAAQMVGDRIAGSLAATSLWGTLIQEILPEFGCGVIPMAQTAIVAPMLESARKATATIMSEDYADFNMTTMSQRPLKGVGVLGNWTYLSTISEATESKCVGASYFIKESGMWMFVPAPNWITGWMSYDPQADANSQASLLLNTPSQAATGTKAQPVPQPQVTDWNKALYKYAKLIYSTNALRGREGTLTGKLRFDIAPGTTIVIKAGAAGGLEPGVDTLATDLFAFVVGVVVNINAEDASAVTTFRLTNIRTAAENEEDRFSTTEHYFFANAYFKGAPLVPDLTPP